MEMSAPAKLNRFLAVLGCRPDGFHALELITTVLEGIPELTDHLTAERSDRYVLTVSGPHAGGLSPDEDNLVTRAWRLLETTVGRELPARLHLHKRIPHGAGLGGGSSDAATALRLGNALFDLNLAASQLLDLAARLGSDVPLFLLGGTVLGLDRGERVFPLQAIPLEPMLLVHPGLHVPTPAVYRALATVGYPPPSPCPSLVPGQAPPWRNDLTEAALHVCPALDEVRQALTRIGGEPLLCGSGSCWVARFPDPTVRDRGLHALRSTHPHWTLWPLGPTLET